MYTAFKHRKIIRLKGKKSQGNNTYSSNLAECINYVMILENEIGTCMVLPSIYAHMHGRAHAHTQRTSPITITTSQLTARQQGIMVH